MKWFYRCDSHDPPLYEDFEGPSSTAMDLDLRHDRREVINRLPDFVMQELLFSRDVQHWWWLRLHRVCKVSLVNENGQTVEEWKREGQSPPSA